ncbi:endolytic transglycosylase MltG [Acidiphilium iwatense]|uniref:Endolytic murein transglycosylase n=1 Tax=Acidiphilium iwatense TaxID=768198 RepID=A0ABS9E2G7_9PROT|nr:endolytic transglycosylase MltG [Acidiphilium iwatense]MCF3948235.1 endolytic transglycosylase MltG [Acidiphilium iwatense]
MRISGRFILLLWTLVIVLGLAKMAVQESYDGPGALAVTRNVYVPPGGLAAVAQRLEQTGVIRHPLVFEIAAWLTRRQGPVRSGEFRFVAHGSLRRILHTLRFGKPVQHKVTIPEGITATQIAAIIDALPEATGHVAPPAEGSVLPQTYDYTYGTPRPAILARMRRAMRRALAKAWQTRAPNLPLQSAQQALTLASIVQLETPVAAELPKIAGVYENRLRLGMKLQADPTVIFAATDGKATALTHRVDDTDLAVQSLYNTYLHHGLPPGPIAAPGLAAIDAVLHPDATRDLYFVATGKGGHAFARTFSGQLANIAHYRAQPIRHP